VAILNVHYHFAQSAVESGVRSVERRVQAAASKEWYGTHRCCCHGKSCLLPVTILDEPKQHKLDFHIDAAMAESVSFLKKRAM
jgi:hypothetical protein